MSGRCYEVMGVSGKLAAGYLAIREREREKKQIARQSPSRRLATPSFLASQVESLRQAVQQEHGEIAGLCGTSAWLWCEEILMSGAAWASLLPSIAKATGPV